MSDAAAADTTLLDMTALTTRVITDSISYAIMVGMDPVRDFKFADFVILHGASVITNMLNTKNYLGKWTDCQKSFIRVTLAATGQVMMSGNKGMNMGNFTKQAAYMSLVNVWSEILYEYVKQGSDFVSSLSTAAK